MHINSNQVNVHSIIVASYRKKRVREREHKNTKKERRRKMKKNVSHHLYCTVASSVSVWGIERVLLPLRHMSIIIIQTVVMCTRVRNWWTTGKNSFENTAVSSLYIREECFLFLFFRISVSDKYVLLMNNLSPAVYIYTIYYYSGTLLFGWTF